MDKPIVQVGERKDVTYTYPDDINKAIEDILKRMPDYKPPKFGHVPVTHKDVKLYLKKHKL